VYRYVWVQSKSLTVVTGAVRPTDSGKIFDPSRRVRKILRRKKRSSKRALLDKGSLSWDELESMSSHSKMRAMMIISERHGSHTRDTRCS